jgi:RimJ/RimL family protein N-acetyltransferase
VDAPNLPRADAPLALREITAADLEFARELRNLTRGSFFDPAPVSAAAQRQWFERYRRSDGYAFYVVWVGDERAGTLSVRDRGEEGSEVGNVALGPAWRGRGIMRRAIRALIESRPEVRRWFAVVKPDNAESLALLQGLGFQPTRVVLELEKKVDPERGSVPAQRS